MSSISSCLLTQVTAFRNPNGPEEVWARQSLRKPASSLKVVIAQVGYLAIIPFAVVETAFNALAKLFSLCLPIGRDNHDAMTQRLQSSGFSILWALTDATINLFCNDLIVTERVARACARSGSLLSVPIEAL